MRACVCAYEYLSMDERSGSGPVWCVCWGWKEDDYAHLWWVPGVQPSRLPQPHPTTSLYDAHARTRIHTVASNHTPSALLQLAGEAEATVIVSHSSWWQRVQCKCIRAYCWCFLMRNVSQTSACRCLLSGESSVYAELNVDWQRCKGIKLQQSCCHLSC